MKANLLSVIVLLISLPHITQAQKILPTNGAKPVDSSFTQMVNYFEHRNPFRKDTLRLPILLDNKDYKVVLADSSLHLMKQRRVLTNPFGPDKYPLSYSVMYQNCLVSLFAPGNFACFQVDDWERNLSLEQQLNTKQFKRHWLLDDHLVGLVNGTYWKFTPKKGWQKYTEPVPFKDHSKLFEDSSFLVYNECKGEFGGRIFFYDKKTQKTYWTSSTCAVWVRHTSQGYKVLSNLGHMMGNASEQLIINPRSLPEWIPTRKMVNESTEQKGLFSLHGVQLFGGLEHKNQVLYLARISGLTGLATLADRTFTVVDPLFNDGLYTHKPVTTNYKGVDLINLDFYGIGRYREIACLVKRNNQITLLDWYEFHRH